MLTRKTLTVSFLAGIYCISAQTLSAVYKINKLERRLSGKDTVYIANFWATWCKPCIQELPIFDSLSYNDNIAVKVLLVNLDFIEDRKKVERFLKEKKIKSECVLLDEVNGNVYVNKISPSWSGAIPATLFKQGARKLLIEKKIKLTELKSSLENFVKHQ